MPPLSALIIEDDEQLADVFMQAMRKAGYAAEIALDGQAARERLQTSRPAVILLDLHLPGLSGAELLESIRADARLIGTRVIIVSGDPYLAADLRPHADLVLIKPVGYVQLRDLARRLLETGKLE